MSLGLGINGISSYGSDPYFMYALSSYNPNFRGVQQTVQQPQVTNSSAKTSTSTANLPKADYSEKDSNAGTVAGVIGTALTAGALIYAYRKGKGTGEGLARIKNGFKKIFGIGDNISQKVVQDRAMKEFRFRAKDGSQIFVKDGKIVNIIEKGGNTEIKGMKEINKLLQDKGIDQKDLLDYKKLKNIKFKDYSFEIDYAGKKILVENGKIAKINGTISADIEKELGGKDAYDNLMKIVKTVEEGGTPRKRTIRNLNVSSYEWSQDGITGSVKKSRRGDYYLVDSVTQNGGRKTLTETERNAYLERNKDLNNTINELIQKGHAEGINVSRFTCFDKKGNKLFVNQKGEIIGVELRDPIKIDGNDVKVLKDGNDRTHLDAWLYNNSEAKDIVKKEFESGLAPDGATFTAV